MRRWLPIVCSLAAMSAVGRPAAVAAAGKSASTTTRWAPAVQPKPLSEHVKRGLEWLVSHQHKGGGWSQGEESSYMGNAMDKVRDIPNVAETCIAALALIRAGSTPRAGEYARNVLSAASFVCGEVERADEQSLYVTSLRGTRVQMKLGPYIDTFLASLLLAEVKGQMPDPKSEKRVAAALEKVLDKIDRNQREDGTWDKQGWAPVLSQSMASKAINRAAQKGARVSDRVRVRAEGYARRQFDKRSGKFRGEGSPGVELYSSAGNLGAMQESDNTNVQQEVQARAVLARPRSDKERKQAQATLQRIEGNRKDLQQAQGNVIGRLEDKRFVSGFGSNGGEEFLSYMSIGESLVVKGGPAWEKWDKSITQNLNRIQNNDGSWTGHHCITGRTFCSAAALLVLTVDRAPVPVAAKMGRR